MKIRSLLLPALALAITARADEGMWTFDNLPLAKMKAKYGFAPDEKWLEHVRLSAIHFGGGSGSFVSKDGLVITNHHVGRGSVQAVSGPGEKDYIKLGFLAKTREEEIKIPNLTLRTLMQMENVSAKVAAAVKPGLDPKAATEARAKVIEDLRAELAKATGLQVQPVSLYQGGENWLYAYKIHTDVRLVMAPEMQIAFFGGDPDNFTYPRHDLDFTLFRIYENGKPYNPPHFLNWASEGLKAGDLTFVIGHPGRTQRQETFAQMKYQRDVGYPVRIAASEARRTALYEYAKKSPEAARQVNTQIFGIENSLKATNGYWDGLKDAEAFAELEKKEKALRAAVAKDPKLNAEVGQSWTQIEKALAALKPLAKEAGLVNTRNSNALQSAVNLVRFLQESAKPAAKRMRGYRTEDELKASRTALGRAPRGSGGGGELESFQFLKALEEVKTELKAEHPFRKALLGGREPADVAKSLEGTKVQDATFRKELLDGGMAALAKSTDPAIQLARRIEPLMADLARKQEAQNTLITEHAARIAKARFKVYGTSLYPDATGTLRLTYGPVEGYAGLGTLIQPFTTFHGLFDRAIGWGPKAENGAWALPQRWLDRKATLNLETPFNFSHKVDIIGGNSGSPVLNAKGEFAGIIFDGNITMLPGNFYYNEKANRGVSLDGRAILEALTKMYDAKFIADELTGK
jgi:hypothetical protein